MFHKQCVEVENCSDSFGWLFIIIFNQLHPAKQQLYWLLFYVCCYLEPCDEKYPNVCIGGLTNSFSTIFDNLIKKSIFRWWSRNSTQHLCSSISYLLFVCLFDLFEQIDDWINEFCSDFRWKLIKSKMIQWIDLVDKICICVIN